MLATDTAVKSHLAQVCGIPMRDAALGGMCIVRGLVPGAEAGFLVVPLDVVGNELCRRGAVVLIDGCKN